MIPHCGPVRTGGVDSRSFRSVILATDQAVTIGSSSGDLFQINTLATRSFLPPASSYKSDGLRRHMQTPKIYLAVAAPSRSLSFSSKASCPGVSTTSSSWLRKRAATLFSTRAARTTSQDPITCVGLQRLTFRNPGGNAAKRRNLAYHPATNVSCGTVMLRATG